MTLQQRIIERIRHEGPISFATYMHMALYEPGLGYYVTGQPKMGWEGDYFTSTDVANFFAACMGRQLQLLWEKLGQPDPFLVLEQGAGRGDLAIGVHAWAAQQAPDLSTALDYRTLDIRMGVNAVSGSSMSAYSQSQSGYLQEVRPGTPQEVGPGTSQEVGPGYPQGDTPTISGDIVGYSRGIPLRVPWPDHQIPSNTFHVILSNELVDAFPVHIVEMRDKHLYELYVDEQDGRLSPFLDEPSSPDVATYLDHYSIPWQTYRDGWRAEINLNALRWMQQVTHMLRKGYLLTIDYGDKARALYSPHRLHGTLTCYYRHQANEQPLAYPGQQDITAHVNFSALIAEGRQHGLRLNLFTTQRQWLENMGIHTALEQLRATQFAAMDAARATDQGQIARLQWRNQQQRVAILTDPAGIGNFKVLLMRRP